MASQRDSDIPVPPGLVLRPFRALRYAADGTALAALTSPPYDVIDDAERAQLLAEDPHNVVRLILPEDGPDGTSRYELAARQLREWQADGDAGARCARRRSTSTRRPRTATCNADWSAGSGWPALTPGSCCRTRTPWPGRSATGSRSRRPPQANLEPIFLVYEGGGAASALVAAADQRTPLLDTTTADGVRHRIWAIDDPAETRCDRRGPAAAPRDDRRRPSSLRELPSLSGGSAR